MRDDLSVLGDYEAKVRALCLDAGADPRSARASEDHERFRWLRYRRMVRRRLTDVDRASASALLCAPGSE